MEHDGIEWTGRGGGHTLHAVAADAPGGRIVFGCGREGWPSEPEGGQPSGRCQGCVEWALRRGIEPPPDERRGRSAAWPSRLATTA